MRIERLRRNLMKKGTELDDIESQLSYGTFLIEREIGTPIMEDYPLMKFHSQLESLVRLKEEEQKAYNNVKGMK